MTSVSYTNIAPYKWSAKKECVTVRDGSDVQMVDETRRHYLYALRVLELGANETPAAQPRTEYLPSDDPRVVIWGDALVSINGAMHLFSINQCTELTHAQDIVDAVWMLAEALGLDESNSNLPGNNTPVPQEQQTTPQQQTHTTPIQTPIGGIAKLGNFDSRDKAQHVEYGVCEFNLSKVGKKYGSTGVLIYELYGTLSDNGMPTKWPVVKIYSDNKFLPPEVRDTLDAVPVGAGGEADVEGTFTAKVNAKGDKTYYNVVAISIGSSSASDFVMPSEEEVSEQDIPF